MLYLCANLSAAECRAGQLIVVEIYRLQGGGGLVVNVDLHVGVLLLLLLVGLLLLLPLPRLHAVGPMMAVGNILRGEIQRLGHQDHQAHVAQFATSSLQSPRIFLRVIRERIGPLFACMERSRT